MQRIKLLIEYDGSGYAGWQYQVDVSTIQGEIEKALRIIFKRPIQIVGAGRTDSGVHARGQVAHLDIPQYDLYKLKKSLNGILSEQVVIKGIEPVSDSFHARFSALSRRYRYYISREIVAINRRQIWYYPYDLNLNIMRLATELIAETEDFKAFCKIKSEVKHYRCEIIHNKLFYNDNGILVYEIEANRFLHGMVRAIVGSMIDLGQGRYTLKEFKEIIKKRDRRNLYTTAPAKGLILEEVKY